VRPRCSPSLGIQPVPGISQRCLQAPHESAGAGDEKIWFSGSVNAKSIGRGINVPVKLVPAAIRADINVILAALSYRYVQPDWNDDLVPADPRADAQADPPADDGMAAARVSAAPLQPVPLLAAALREMSAERHAEIGRRWPHLTGKNVAVVMYTEDGAIQRARWTIGAGPSAWTAGPADVTIAGDAVAWAHVLDGQVSMAAACGSGQLRIIGSQAGSALPEEAHVIACMLGVPATPSLVSPLAGGTRQPPPAAMAMAAAHAL
jgi:hypothetical protein